MVGLLNIVTNIAILVKLYDIGIIFTIQLVWIHTVRMVVHVMGLYINMFVTVLQAMKEHTVNIL